ncbi:uncharacterized protein LOC121329406 [Polyodon spathula]|uniref:uncharacterized protein LOC121329406 n=1 Tax=Polyodon spathula TaxID=7913 RepID=UPI001B7F1435|nr:uncharacterized protein LOC121329406 [Polyodon spathula]
MNKVPPSPTVEFPRISDWDLTEIELHSVESINDLQRLNNSELLKDPLVAGGGPRHHQDNGNLPAPAQAQHAVHWHRPPCCSPACCRYLWVCIAVLLALLLPGPAERDPVLPLPGCQAEEGVCEGAGPARPDTEGAEGEPDPHPRSPPSLTLTAWLGERQQTQLPGDPPTAHTDKTDWPSFPFALVKYASDGMSQRCRECTAGCCFPSCSVVDAEDSFVDAIDNWLLWLALVCFVCLFSRRDQACLYGLQNSISVFGIRISLHVYYQI